MSYRVLSLTALLVMACPRQAPSPTQEVSSPNLPSVQKRDLRSQVDVLLTGYERTPAPEDWKQLGPDAFSVLWEIYSDPAALVSKRSRAVTAMSWVDNPAASEALKKLAADETGDLQYRTTAAFALAQRVGSDALPTLKSLLEHSDPVLREAAARAVGRVGNLEARRLLETRLGREQEAAVREAIQQSLTALHP